MSTIVGNGENGSVSGPTVVCLRFVRDAACDSQQERVAHQRRVEPRGSRRAGGQETTFLRCASVDYYSSDKDTAAKRHD
jgi:hypothetical protein